MKPRIAIPQPHSRQDYTLRSLPQYKHAIEAAGGEAIEVPLDATSEEVANLAKQCQAVLLPGSPADIDPQKFSAIKHPQTAPADPGRDSVDELLLQDAYNMRKPVLGICYGLQSLNVWRSGTLVQHIESPGVNHEAGRQVEVAHKISVEHDSLLATALRAAGIEASLLPVNSSHHQSAEVVGDGLRAVARCAEDGVIEAVEGTNPDHFVLAVQWHPERGYDADRTSQAIFQRFVAEARAYSPKPLASTA